MDYSKLTELTDELIEVIHQTAKSNDLHEINSMPCREAIMKFLEGIGQLGSSATEIVEQKICGENYKVIRGEHLYFGSKFIERIPSDTCNDSNRFLAQSDRLGCWHGYIYRKNITNAWYSHYREFADAEQAEAWIMGKSPTRT